MAGGYFVVDTVGESEDALAGLSMAAGSRAGV
jgi:hypothetical protein